jgi:plasmid stabilization system protein ParE
VEKAQKEYEVIITRTAEIYFYELAEYLYEHMSLERAEQTATSLHTMALSLNRLYNRGSVEKTLFGKGKRYRYLLFKRTSRADIKIIYYEEESAEKVYVTDFVPVEKNPDELQQRNK